MTETSRRRARRFLVAAVACAAVAPTTPALAAPDQQSLIEDETLMLDSGPAVQAQSLDEAKALGADVIRANVIWARFAPVAELREEAQGLRRQEPGRVSRGRVRDARLLRAGAQARGMEVLLTATGPIPRLGVALQGARSRRARTCKPDPKLFGAFVRALGTRYPTVKNGRSGTSRTCARG